MITITLIYLFKRYVLPAKKKKLKLAPSFT